MKYPFGFPWYYWLLLFILIVFGPYITKTFFSNLYTTVTKKPVPDEYLKKTIYGTPDYRYQMAKDILQTKQ